MKSILIIILFIFILVNAQALETQESLSLRAWSVPRDGDVIRNMPALRNIMAALQTKATSRLLIHFPGGDEGTLWAHELRGWLVSLGLASNRIELVPGHHDGESILLNVTELPDAGSEEKRFQEPGGEEKLGIGGEG